MLSPPDTWLKADGLENNLMKGTWGASAVNSCSEEGLPCPRLCWWEHSQWVPGKNCFPLFSTCQSASGAMSWVLRSPLQERCWHSAVSLLRCLELWANRRRGTEKRICSAWGGKGKGTDLTSVYSCLLEDTEKIEPDLSWRCTRLGGNRHSIQNSH